jgi:hypothetical protein
MRGQKIILKSILSEYSGAVTAPNIDIGTPWPQTPSDRASCKEGP